jgi:class 3 adenylate cyclase/tetratricopeptide (TPR) repeat protein
MLNPSMSTQTCPRCGQAVPAEGRFCSNCGAPLDAEVAEERKVVTVAFADLAGSTELAARLDPERFREVISAFYREATTAVGALRGRVEKFAGDSVMAVFGLPHAHDDDALRAVRAGLEIRDRTARLGSSLGLPVALQVRVGVNTGAVSTGSGPADQFLVSGAAVNLAARLEQAASPGEVLVGEMTHQLTMHAAMFDDGRLIAAKGFEDAVFAYPITALSARSSRRTIPIVGRRRELDLLTGTFERTRETSRAHLVTVLGEPGIGKSRLVEEFTSRLPEGAKVLTGRASEFAEDVIFSPIAEMIRREIGADLGTPASELAKRLEELVGGCCDPSEVEQVAGQLGLSLGIGDAPAQERPYRLAEVRAGLVRLLEGIAVTATPVLVFEDMELARPSLLELVEQVVARSRRLPILVLVVARDWLLETRPGWGGGLHDAVTIRLETLPDDAAAHLAQASAEGIDEAGARRIAQHAGGNPFFIVETTGMLAHEAAGHGGADHVHVGGRLLPPTVQAVVASRIDHLDEPARDLVRKASVFAGSTFNTSELALIAEPSDDVLGRLEDEELLVRDERRPGVWRFNHGVVRDVAYDSLAKRERLRLHVTIADRLVEQSRSPFGVAFHLEQAAKASVDLDPAARALPDRAVDALREAGDLARRRIESRVAVDFYDRALGMAGPDDGWDIREARILAGIGEARYWLGDYDQATAVLERALRIGRDDTWTRTFAHRFLGDIVLNIRGDVDRAEAHFSQALSSARQITEDTSFAVARTLLVAGWAPYARGDLDAARAMFTEALSTVRANPERDSWAEARALSFLASIASQVGNEPEAVTLAEEAMSIARASGDRFSLAVAQQRYATSLFNMGRAAEALPQTQEAVGAFTDLGARWEAASALGDLGELLRYMGRPRDAEGPLREALKICRELHERQLFGWVTAELALALRALGRTDEARVLVDEASGPIETEESISFLRARAIIAMQEGDRDVAEAAARRILEEAKAPNSRARQVLFAGRLLGAEFVGGEGEMQAARERLESINWLFALDDPDLV